MKNIINILVALFLLGGYSTFAQTITQEEKYRIISDLDSVHSYKCTEAIDQVIEYRIVEALSKIEDNFWKVRLRTKPLFLYALREFNSTKAYEFAKGYLDSLKIYTGIDTTDIYIDKSYAITILFKNNDFSYSDYILNLLCCKESQYETALSLFYYIIKNDPANSLRAMSLLINTARNAEISSVRSSALFYYNLIKGKEALPLLVNSYLNDTDAKVRGRILNQYFLKEYVSPEIEVALRSKIKIEESPINRSEAALVLLREYSSPVNYKIVSDLEQMETESFTKQSLKNKINSYVAIRPSDTLFVMALIDSLLKYNDQIFDYGWLKNEQYKSELFHKLQNAKNYLITSDSVNCVKEIKSFQSSIQQVYSDSAGSYPKHVSEHAYKFLYYYPKYILERLPKLPAVKLNDSHGSLLPGGSLQYYEGGWKDAINNNDGTFSIGTKLKTLSLRMTYEYGSQTKSNVTVGADTVVFQTVNALVKLQDSNSNAIDTGKVQYYAGGWRNFGQTINGTASKELLAANYTFRVSYAFASNDKAQNLDTNSTVVFQTVNTNVELRNSLGNLIDAGTVQYYSGGWREFGTTSNGIASKELLPNNYTFRMSYGFANNDKAQNTATNSTVVFQTVNTNVELRNSLNTLIDNGTVQYYSGGWREFGTTSNGIASKELLPNNYTFRMTHEFISNDKQQNIGTDRIVPFKTVLCTVRVKNQQNQMINNARASYYSGGWRVIGNTVNGEITKELLPANLTFRINSGTIQQDKTQNISTNNLVEFTLVQ